MPRRKELATKPCRRCGIPCQSNPATKVPYVCKDCRWVDPAFVRAIATGQRCA